MGPEQHEDDVGILLRAVAFAAERHRMQRRKDIDASPYINHPIAVAHLLKTEGNVSDVVTLCAALLHDTIEDTQTTPEDLAVAFGPEIAEVVLEVTDDKSLDQGERKVLQIEHAPHLSPRAKLVKLADKICNVRDMALAPPAGWSQARRGAYCAWAAAVVAGLTGTNPRLERLFDEALAARPA